MSQSDQAKSSLVRRTVAVLRAVARRPDGLGLSDVSKVSGIPKATCLRILQVLEEERLIRMDEGSKRYVLALGIIGLASPVLSEGSGIAMLQNELTQLAADTGETSGLDILEGGKVVVLLESPSPQLISQAPKPVPRSLPVFNTSTGKALAAHQPESMLKTLLGDRGPTEVRRILEELERVRTSGLSQAVDELEEGAAAIACPVIVDGVAICAVWIGGPTFRFSENAIGSMAKRLRASTKDIGGILRASPRLLAGHGRLTPADTEASPSRLP